MSSCCRDGTDCATSKRVKVAGYLQGDGPQLSTLW